jgi:superfamily II DNA or RNA helicase
MKLRDYQERDVERLREAMRLTRRTLYVAPTGSGKTVLFAHIAGGCWCCCTGSSW